QPIAHVALQVQLPRLGPAPVRPSAVRKEEEPGRSEVSRQAVLLPPPGDGPHREPRSVVRRTDHYISFVPAQIVNPKGGSAALRRAGEVVLINLLCLSTPGPSAVPKRPDQLLLLGIDANDGQTTGEERVLLESNVSKLLITLEAAGFDLPSSVRLQREPHAPQ